MKDKTLNILQSKQERECLCDRGSIEGKVNGVLLD